MTLYRSEDSGNSSCLAGSNGLKDLYLKIGAPVILTANLSSKLVNGLQGTVVEMNPTTVTVNFHSLGSTHTVGRYGFTVYSPREMKNIAVRKQIPLRLAFAITVHRAQGMTLERTIIDCRNMSNPGQIGVAVGRVKCKKGLSITNFSTKLLCPHPSVIHDYYRKGSKPILPDQTCCKKPRPDLKLKEHVLSEPKSPAHETGNSDDKDNQDSDEEMIRQLEQFECSQDSEQLGSPETGSAEMQYSIPETVHIDDILNNMKYKTCATSQQTDLNRAIDYLITNPMLTNMFANAAWNKIKLLFNKCVGDVGKDSIKNKHMSAFAKQVSTFQQSESYLNLVKNLFKTQEPKSEQYRACFRLFESIRKNIVDMSAEEIKDEARKCLTTGQIAQGSVGGRAKLRHIGGWCIAKLKHKKKKVVSRNLYKASTKDTVMQLDKEVKYLEHLTQSETFLLENSDDKQSLLYVKSKQNIRGSLTNISDGAFLFFTHLDEAIQCVETELNMNLYGKDFYTFITKEIENNSKLFSEWELLLSIADTDSTIVRSLYNEVVAKYLNMSSAQFRKTYKRKIQVQKEEAHRKQIRMGAKPSTSLLEKSATSILGSQPEEQTCPTSRTWKFDDILHDTSLDKVVSHRKLQNEIENDVQYLSKRYKKDELITLCTAYGVAVKQSLRKDKIAETLKSHILHADKMPVTQVLKPKAAESTCSSSESSSVRKIQYPCGQCGKECEDTDCVACDLCDIWYHIDCAKCSQEDLACDWYCEKCKTGQ